MAVEPVSEPLPDDAERAHNASIAEFFARQGYAVIEARRNENGRDEVRLQDGWHYCRDLLDAHGGKP